MPGSFFRALAGRCSLINRFSTWVLNAEWGGLGWGGDVRTGGVLAQPPAGQHAPDGSRNTTETTPPFAGTARGGHAPCEQVTPPTLHRKDEATAPTTAHAAHSLCAATRIANTRPDTTHLVCGTIAIERVDRIAVRPFAGAPNVRCGPPASLQTPWTERTPTTHRLIHVAQCCVLPRSRRDNTPRRGLAGCARHRVVLVHRRAEQRGRFERGARATVDGRPRRCQCRVVALGVNGCSPAVRSKAANGCN
jgi:hypothetical protein